MILGKDLDDKILACSKPNKELVLPKDYPAMEIQGRSEPQNRHFFDKVK